MLDIDRHKFILVNILKDIYSTISISSLLGLKGGTALYLFYNIPRFSVDLDLNLLDLEEKEKVFQIIGNILKKVGVLKDEREKKDTLFFLLSYGEKARNIKVEVSKRVFPDHYELKNYLGISMLVLKKEDMFAHKLVALSERKSMANRDLFDLWFFMKNNWEINEEIVELRAGLKLNNYLNDCIKKVERINERYILQGLGEILDEKKKQWAKENLKKDLLFYLRYYLEKSSVSK
jgi:predicted nucleotidyltransferase component of viral defense system